MRKSVEAIVTLGLIAMFSLAGCGGNSSINTLGATNAPMVFVKAIALPNNTPLIGYDISWIDPQTRTYYLGAAQLAGVITLDLNSINTPSPVVKIISPSAPNAFAGNINDPNHPYQGGPNGVVTVNGAEIWAVDGNTYAGNGGSPNATYSNDNCDSSVKIINIQTSAVSTVYTNGCFKSDELSFDSVDQVVLVANPNESNIGVNKPGVPTVPFISLISTKSDHSVLTQIPFDGTNNTPNAINGIEQSVYSSTTGYFYVAVPNDGNVDPTLGAIAVVDPVHRAVIQKLPVFNCNPAGMDLGPDGKEVFLSCQTNTGPQVVSLDGNMIASFPASVPIPPNSPYFGPMCDEALYNSALNEYMAACNFAYNNANFTVIDAGTGLDPTTIQFRENVLTNSNGLNSIGVAHSIASDPVTGAVIVPLPVGDPYCSSPGCIAVFAPKGSNLQMGGQ